MLSDRTYSHSPFRGQIFCPAPVTPFAAGGEVMWDAVPEALGWYMARGADALLIAGNNGEGYALTPAELGRLTEAAAKAVAGRVPFYVNVTRTSNKESVRLAEIAAAAGAPGICLMGQPFIHAATTTEIVDRFAAVARAVPLPMMVFNSFHYTQFVLTPAILRAICDVAPVSCMKDTYADFDHITAMLAEMGDRFPIMYGGARTLVWTLLLGSGGFVGTGVEFFGLDCKRQFLAAHGMAPAERLSLALRFKAVSEAVQRLAPPPAGLKAALAMVGVPAGVPREPVQAATAEIAARIREALAGAGLIAERVARRA